MGCSFSSTSSTTTTSVASQNIDKSKPALLPSKIESNKTSTKSKAADNLGKIEAGQIFISKSDTEFRSDATVDLPSSNSDEKISLPDYNQIENQVLILKSNDDFSFNNREKFEITSLDNANVKELIREVYIKLRVESVIDLNCILRLCRQNGNYFIGDYPEAPEVKLMDDDIKMAFKIADPMQTGYLNFRRFIRLCIALDNEIQHRENSFIIFSKLTKIFHVASLQISHIFNWEQITQLINDKVINEQNILECFQTATNCQISDILTSTLNFKQFLIFIDLLSVCHLNINYERRQLKKLSKKEKSIRNHQLNNKVQILHKFFSDSSISDYNVNNNDNNSDTTASSSLPIRKNSNSSDDSINSSSSSSDSSTSSNGSSSS